MRPQLPLALDDASEPEPDVVVVRGGAWDYVSAHPSAPALVVEIAETSLVVDREHKSGLYARAGVADYWIVNLREAVLEIYRQPTPIASAPLGWGYGIGERLTSGAAVSPLAARLIDPSTLPICSRRPSHRRPPGSSAKCPGRIRTARDTRLAMNTGRPSREAQRPGARRRRHDPTIARGQQPKRGGTVTVRAWDPPHFDPHLTVAYKTIVPNSFALSRLVRHRAGPGIAPGRTTDRTTATTTAGD